jgi:hypothetical protein
MTPECFWSKVYRLGIDECWIWKGRTSQIGHGVISTRWKARPYESAHRFAYKLLVGPIPDALVLDHFRMNPGPRHAVCSRLCVNPSHMGMVTPGENVLRGNSPSAIHARAKTCKRGHSLIPDTGSTRKGWRRCPTCDREKHAAAYVRRRT